MAKIWFNFNLKQIELELRLSLELRYITLIALKNPQQRGGLRASKHILNNAYRKYKRNRLRIKLKMKPLLILCKNGTEKI
jgi:hypothetical protein